MLKLLKNIWNRISKFLGRVVDDAEENAYKKWKKDRKKKK
jgi:hypothetical protein